jgi:hypothetical protein
MQQGRLGRIVEVLLILIQFEDICSDNTGEHDTRNSNQFEGSSQH